MGGIEKKFADLDGTRMAYTETGTGDPIVFLHGNPTSSYLWRHVIAEVGDLGHCLAPDLIGMGDSDKLADSGPGSYTFVEHREYLDAWFETVGATSNLVLVGHDWGSALGFDWARRHPDAMRGIAYMEAAVRPGRWADFPPPAVELFRALRSPAGEQMILEHNMFVEAVLPAGVLNPLEPEALSDYRRPFTEPGESRRPTLTWPRQIPLDGEPGDMTAIMEDYGAWLTASRIPKLFINADPGQVLVGPARDFCRGWPNQTEVTVPGLHFIQEDSGEQVGQALRSWLQH